MRAAEAAALLLLLFLTGTLLLGIGLGDTKIAGLLGLVLGFRSWSTVYDGMLVAFVLAASFVAIRGRLRRPRGRIPLGPYLVAGAVIAVLL